MKDRVYGEVETADAQLLPVLLAERSAVNLKVRLDMLEHELHVHGLLVEGLRRPVRVPLVGDNRSQIERLLVLALHRALHPVILRKVHNQAGLVKLVLRGIAYMRLQNEIAATVRPQAMSVVVAESVVRPLPEVASRIRNEDDLVILDAVRCGLTEPRKSVRQLV